MAKKKRKFIVYGSGGVTYSAEIEATSIEEAIKIAKGNEVDWDHELDNGHEPLELTEAIDCESEDTRQIEEKDEEDD